MQGFKLLALNHQALIDCRIMRIKAICILAFIVIWLMVGNPNLARQSGQRTIKLSLNEPLDKSEAQIWYLDNSGWAIRTKSHFLIFDYIGRQSQLANEGLASGQIALNEIKDKRTFVFVTHQHQDHFSEKIFEWESSVKDITYVFGWPIDRPGSYVRLNPRESKKVGDVEISTIKSTDLGVGFLVRVDGLTIFHAGDHAQWADGFRKSYQEEINHIAEVAPSIDLAFIPVAAGFRAGCKPSDSITEGANYAVDKLKAKAVFPMHIICSGMLNVYKEFAEGAVKRNINSKVMAAEASGDGFHYVRGDVARQDER